MTYLLSLLDKSPISSDLIRSALWPIPSPMRAMPSGLAIIVSGWRSTMGAPRSPVASRRRFWPPGSWPRPIESASARAA